MIATKPDAVGSLPLGYDLALQGGRRAGFTISVLIHLILLLFLSRSYRFSPPPPRRVILAQAKMFVPPLPEKPEETLRTPAPLAAPTKFPRSITEPEVPSKGNPISADEVQLDRESLELVDPAGQVEEVLSTHDGSVGFSVPDEEGHLQHIFQAPNWTPLNISGYIPAERYCSFTMVPPWAIATRIANANGLPRNSIAYVIFERSMCNNLWRMIREFAGQKGIDCVKHTKLRFDLANEKLGFSILDLNKCEGQQGPKQ